VTPGADHEKVHVVVRVLRFGRGIRRRRSIDVLLIPLTVDVEGRHGKRLPREDPVDRLSLPERIVSRMTREPLPERQLVHAKRRPERTGRAGGEPGLVGIVTRRRPFLLGTLVRRLAVDVIGIGFAERAVVKPVVADPRVDHRIEWDGGFQRRMRMDETHQDGETVVARAHGGDFAVALGHVVHQPLDRVVGIGRMIDPGIIELPGKRPVHDVRSFGLIFTAHVLGHDDIALCGQFAKRIRQGERSVRARRARRELRGAIRRAIEHDGRMGRALRYDDDREQLHAVAHRNHDLAFVEVVECRRRAELGRDVACGSGARGDGRRRGSRCPIRYGRGRRRLSRVARAWHRHHEQGNGERARRVAGRAGRSSSHDDSARGEVRTSMDLTVCLNLSPVASRRRNAAPIGSTLTGS